LCTAAAIPEGISLVRCLLKQKNSQEERKEKSEKKKEKKKKRRDFQSTADSLTA